jgi:hypothetical protein
MATAPKAQPADAEEEIVLKPGHTLPGYTVDALLAAGKVEEARGELERLLQEGIDSGLGIPMDDSLAENVMAKARARVMRSTSR